MRRCKRPALLMCAGYSVRQKRKRERETIDICCVISITTIQIDQARARIRPSHSFAEHSSGLVPKEWEPVSSLSFSKFPEQT